MCSVVLFSLINALISIFWKETKEQKFLDGTSKFWLLYGEPVLFLTSDMVYFVESLPLAGDWN